MTTIVFDDGVVARNVGPLTGRVPAELLGLLVAAGFWTPQQALAHALNPDSLRDRSAALYRRLPDPMPTDPRGIAAAEGAPTVQHQRDEVQANALADVAPFLPPQLIGEALTVAAAIGGEPYRAWALKHLLPCVPGDLLGVAVPAVTAFTDQYWLATTLAAALPHVPPGQRPAVRSDAVAAVAAIDRLPRRVEASAALARHLPAAQRTTLLREALALVADLPPHDRPRLVGILAPHLPPALLDTALAMTAGLPDEERLETWGALLPHLHGEQRATVLRDAVHTVDGMDLAGAAVVGLAAFLPIDTLTEVARAVGAVTDPESRAIWLIDLIPHLPEPLRTTTAADVLVAIAELDSERWRVRLLCWLAHVGADTHLDQILTEMLTVARQEWRTEGLVVLAPCLSAALRRRALAATDAIPDLHRRAEAWAALAAHQTLTTRQT
ncbi:hypothetical protein ACFO1B_31630 [Dactylosporangium siamense]|uniref:Uncharacterized protein n=1 Tax=Dactylosporangium siamense TaxID=685454 RepID=A0A919PPU2_9ACTN|nr:hypothetical protein [Dactylosporangium siamense]GIG48690.1 hypothetical protein Dsi01nite_067310 [Dactylosporangium siamense]